MSFDRDVQQEEMVDIDPSVSENDSEVVYAEVITDNTIPGHETFVRSAPRIPPTHDQETRKLLALLILGALGILYLGIISAFIFGLIPETGLTAAIAGISGLQALGAAAIGFYYGSQKDK